MIRLRTKLWTINEDTSSLLFFAQRLNEALFDYTPERYKASALYVVSSCREVLNIIGGYRASIWPLQTIQTVYKEFRHLYKNDLVAKELVGEIGQYYLIEVDKNIDSLQSNLELLYYKIKPMRYWEKTKVLLKRAIEGKNNIEVEQLTLCLINVLLDLGYSQEYIYHSAVQVFFKEKIINNLDSLDIFYNLFSQKQEKYDVYINVNEFFKNIEEIAKKFEIEICNDRVFLSKMKQQKDQILIKIQNIVHLDPMNAKRDAFYRIARLGNLFAFYHHKQRVNIVSKKCIVYNQDQHKEYSLNTSISPMLKGFDYMPESAAKKLNGLFQNFDSSAESFSKVLRCFDFHGVSIDNKFPENQLLQNWIALEMLIVQNRDSSKIDQILSALLPVLDFEYIKKIFIDFSANITNWEDKTIYNILMQKIPEGEKPYEKLAALVTIDTNLSVASEIFEFCDDFPLFRYRIFWLNRLLKDAREVTNFISSHSQRVEWHIRRLYRARNYIVHQGDIPSITDRLVESSHSYLDTFLNTVIAFCTKDDKIGGIENLLNEVRIRNKMHREYLNKDKNLKCVDNNYKKILWGEFD